MDQRLIISSSPHVQSKESVSRIMWSVVAALLPATIAGVYFFGVGVLGVIICTVAAAAFTEAIFQHLRGQKITVWDGSAVITGLLLALNLPPGIPVWIAVLGAVFAIAIGKQIFGGLGRNPFNPALVGRAFLLASFPVHMTTWISPDGVTSATPLALLKMEGQLTPYMDLFLGNVGGTIGETSAVAILIGGLYLLYKGYIDWRIPLSYIGTVAVLALAFGEDPLIHILSGGLMLGAFFMATDMVTSPITKKGRYLFGIGAGILVIVIRLWGGYPEGVSYSILLMNGLVPLLDRWTVPHVYGEVKSQ